MVIYETGTTNIGNWTYYISSAIYNNSSNYAFYVGYNYTGNYGSAQYLNGVFYNGYAVRSHRQSSISTR